MDRLALDYFYASPLPNRFAASIQILRTGAALADRGGRFAYRTGALTGSEADILADYGLAPRNGFRLAPFFAASGMPRLLRSLALRGRFAAALRRGAAEPGRHVLMARGDAAFRLLPLLERLAPGRRPTLVYEMHRLAHLRAAEKRLGRRAGAADLATEEAQATLALEARVLRVADGVVFLTPGVAAAAAEAFALDKPQLVLPSGVDPPVAPGIAPAPDLDVVYAGKIEARKGVHDLCAAMAYLPGRRLAVAGGPVEAIEPLRREVAALGLGDRIEILGWLPPAKVDAFLRRGRVGVCPLPAGVDAVSDSFTSPMKLLQMMALGLPVVATDLPPVRAVVTDGKDALLAPPNDPAALAAAILRLLEDPEGAARLASAARDRAAGYAWPQRAAQLEAFLLGLPGTPTKRP